MKYLIHRNISASLTFDPTLLSVYLRLAVMRIFANRFLRVSSHAMPGRFFPPSNNFNHRNNSIARFSHLYLRHNVNSKRGDSVDKVEDGVSRSTFNLGDLGASPGLKITIYTVIGVLGTIETIFWTKALWRYFSTSSEDK